MPESDGTAGTVLNPYQVRHREVVERISANRHYHAWRDREWFGEPLEVRRHLGAHLIAVVEFGHEPAELLLRFEPAGAVDNMLDARLGRELPDVRHRFRPRAEPEVPIVAAKIAALEI